MKSLRQVWAAAQRNPRREALNVILKTLHTPQQNAPRPRSVGERFHSDSKEKTQ